MIKILHCADIYYTHDTHIVGERLQKPFQIYLFHFNEELQHQSMLGAHPQMLCQKISWTCNHGTETQTCYHSVLPVVEFILVSDSFSLFFLLLKCWELNPGLHVYWASALLLGSIYRSTFVVLRLKQILPKAHHKNINQFLCKLGNCNFRSKKIAQAIKSLPHKHVIL